MIFEDDYGGSQVKKRTLPILLACVCLLSVVLSACGVSEPTVKESSAPSKPELTQDPVSITLTERFVSDERTAILREIADKYEADHSNVTIEVQTLQTEEEIKAALKSGKADIAELSDQTLFSYADEGLLMDISSDFKYWEETYTLTAAAQDVLGSYDYDAIYFVPHTLYQLALCYRTDWLKTAGLFEHQLATWEDLYSFAKQTMESGKSEYGLVINFEDGIYHFADMLMWSYLGNWKMAAPYQAYYKMGNSSDTIFTMDETKEGLEMFYKLMNGLVPPIRSGAPGFEAAEAFIEGLSPMIVADPSDIYKIEHNMSEELWAAIPLPTSKNSSQSFFSNCFDGWGLSATAKNRNWTADFLLYLSNSDNNTYFVKNNGGIPIHTDATEKDEFFIDTGLNVFMVLSKRPGTYQFATPPKMYDAFEAYEQEVGGRYERYLSDALSADELLFYLDGYWREAYETEGQRWPEIEIKTTSSVPKE